MYIGLVIYGRLDTISGGYLYDRKLVAYLQGNGDKVEIISLPRVSYGRSLLHNISTTLYHRLLNARFDVLLQDELNHPSLLWLNRRLHGRIQYPIVSIVHHLRSSEVHPAWQNPLYRRVEQRYLQTVDGFIFNSQTTRQAVEKLVGGKRPFVVVYPAGDRFQTWLSEEEIVKRAWQPGPLRLIFVGNLIERKGLHLLLDALTQLPFGSWQLEVVGNTAVSPAYTHHIEQQIKTADWAHAVTLHGSLPDETLANYLATSHLLVVPSSYEGFGIVYLEGMAFGLPAMAGAEGAAHEIITDGKNGFLVGDSAVLAQRLATLQKNRHQLAQMSLTARQYFLTRPGWEENMASIRPFLLHNG